MAPGCRGLLSRLKSGEGSLVFVYHGSGGMVPHAGPGDELPGDVPRVPYGDRQGNTLPYLDLCQAGRAVTDNLCINIVLRNHLYEVLTWRRSYS